MTLKSFSLALLLCCSCGMRHGSPQTRAYLAEQKAEGAVLKVDYAHQRINEFTRRVEVLEALIQRVDMENKEMRKRLSEIQQSHELLCGGKPARKDKGE